MIKVEYFVGEASATVERQGETVPLFVGFNIAEDELASVKVTNGAICISVDELELYHIDASGSKTLVFPVPVTAEEAAVEVVVTPVAEPVVEPTPEPVTKK